MKKFLKRYTIFFLVLTMIIGIGANSFTYSIDPPENSEVPEEQQIPEESREQYNSEKLKEPQYPTVPDNPEESQKPTVPDNPEEAQNPTEPDNPEEPQIPIKTENPQDPEELQNPTEPDNPVEPEIPEEPIDPQTPVDPEEPANPSLSMEVKTDTREYIIGEVINYAISIRNDGDVNLESLFLEDSFTGNESIGNLYVGEELIFNKEYEIVEDYEVEEFSNSIKVTGLYNGLEVFAETSFTVSINLGFGKPLEDISPPEEEPIIELPDYYYGDMKRVNPMSGELLDTIEVFKTAEITQGCRAFKVDLQITGTPQSVPVDVVIVIDRSGSMNDTVNDYAPIASNPVNNGSYYVKIDDSYQSITRHSGDVWRYGGLFSRRYVIWDPNGDDTATGSSDPNNPTRKPFYEMETRSRLYYAKRAAANFAGKVLGPEGIPGSRISIVSFNGPGYSGEIGTENDATLNLRFNSNLRDVVDTINGIRAEYGTNTQAGFRRAKNHVIDNGNSNSNKVVIMFTDGMPTASIGNPSGPNAPTSHNAHTRAAYEEGQSIFEYADVFTIGLLDGLSGVVKNLAIDTLTRAQNRGFYEAPTAQDLDEIFNLISEQLGYAATNAGVEDKINDNFDFVRFIDSDPNDPFKSADGKAVYDPIFHKITWKVGTIVDNENISYKIKAKLNFNGGDNIPTNDYARLRYTDVNNNPGVTKDFPVPLVYVPSPLTIVLPEEIEIIIGDSVNLGDYLDVTGGYPDYTYKWIALSDSSLIWDGKNAIVNPSDNACYEVEVTDLYGCKTTDRVLVRVIKGTITIIKAVEGGDNSGETFPVYLRGDGKEWAHLAYDGSRFTIENLRFGNYSISEVVPARYKLVSISQSEVTIDRDNLNITVTITNKKNLGGYFDDKDERDNLFTVGNEIEIDSHLPQPTNEASLFTKLIDFIIPSRVEEVESPVDSFRNKEGM